MKYNTVFIAGDVTVVLIEQAVASAERIVEVRVDGKSVGTVSLIRSYYPRVATGSDKVFVWGGARLYWASTKDDQLRRVDVDDEVHAVYALDFGWWCLLGETSVSLWNESDGVTSTTAHNEVLVDTWRKGHELHLRDLQRRVLRVIIDLDLRSVVLEPIEKGSDIAGE